MKLPSESQMGSQDDKDISALLKKQTIPVPASLDDSILAASKSNAAVAIAKPRLPHRSPWLAVAATVILAIFVAPLMLTTPESSLESERSRVLIQESAPAAISIQADTKAAVASEADNAQSLKTLKKPAPRALISSDTAAVNSMEIDLTDETYKYRNTPEDWIEEINRLISDAQHSLAEEEYDLFRAIYPSYETNIQLPQQNNR